MKKEPPKQEPVYPPYLAITLIALTLMNIAQVAVMIFLLSPQIVETNRLLSTFQRIDTVKDGCTVGGKPCSESKIDDTDTIEKAKYASEGPITKNDALNTEDCSKQLINNGQGDSHTFYNQRFENCALYAEEAEIEGGFMDHHPNPMAFTIKFSEVPQGRKIMVFHNPIFRNSRFDHVIFITVKPDFQAETTDDPNICYHWDSDCKSSAGGWSECTTVCHMQPEPK